jgi:hypothetical protein
MMPDVAPRAAREGGYGRECFKLSSSLLDNFYKYGTGLLLLASERV